MTTFRVGSGEYTVSGTVGELPLEGEKLWSTFVEPPWEYEIRAARLHLDVMGKKSVFDVRGGPDEEGAG